MNRQPPAVPSVMAVAQITITHVGMWNDPRKPWLTSAMVMTPMDYCASVVPCEKAMNAAESICMFWVVPERLSHCAKNKVHLIRGEQIVQ